MASRIRLNENGGPIKVSYDIKPRNSHWSIRYFGLNGSEIHHNTNELQKNPTFEIPDSPTQLVNRENSFTILLVNSSDNEIKASVEVSFTQEGEPLGYLIDGQSNRSWTNSDDELEPGKFLGGQFGTGDSFRFKNQ